MFNIIVISLARTPERWESFQNSLGNNDWPINRLWGVDGQNLNTRELSHLKGRGLISDSALRWPKGQIGCALSHQLCWRSCINSNTPTLVLEDDAILAQGWQQKLSLAIDELPEKYWDILLLGWNFDSCLEYEWAEKLSATLLFRPRFPTSLELQRGLNEVKTRTWKRLRKSLGLAGYILSVEGATRLLEWSKPLRTLEIKNPELPSRSCFSLDGQLNDLYPSISAWVITPPLIVGANQKGESLTSPNII
ncbi:glycosyltransferase family 25 protein [Prochlorococcus sp. MIT 1300]|uniref:glycosyltransferase family 25 protein n=1 Tax=Prochlorococcus sp. MIT 1300 TaxID=3096218 RepID=UPI002A75898D|nr:glycosyltransferase family 25 protein [Prochlorococcus sp. MIT 1300]